MLTGLCLCLSTLLTAVDLEAGDENGPPSDGGFRQAEAGYRYRFPWDHGSHDTFRTEWWYYTGHLTSANGRRFGYQLTFFRYGINSKEVRSNPSRWAVRHLYLAHFALSDPRTGRFRYAEKVSRAGIGKAGAEAGSLHVWIDRWVAETTSPHREAHHLNASASDFSIDLFLTMEKPPIVHGDQGISRKGAAPGQASHYYSVTRLATTGTLAMDGEILHVTGTSWMDHEFGSGTLGRDQVGWDWFSVQLENNIELMIYRLRRLDGSADPASSGTLVFEDGRSRFLTASDLAIDVLDHWASATSGACYPSRWRLSVPSLALSLELIPELADQELMTSKSTQVTYWEGAVQVSGSYGKIRVTGQGYVELTGYAAPIRLQP